MTAIERRVSDVVDRLLLERGEIDPLHCLFALGAVRSVDHDAWRYTGGTALLVPSTDAIGLLEQVHAYASAQGFEAVPREPASLRAPIAPADGAKPRLSELCDCVLRHVEDRVQPDLFHDSAQTVVLNELRAALWEHRVEAARAALQRLRGVGAEERTCADYGRLLAAVATPSTRPAERLQELEVQITPLARRYLGAGAHDYLVPLWRKLATALAGDAFAPEAPARHESYARARAHEWAEVVRSIEREPSWPAHGELVARLAEAWSWQGRQDVARSLWARLCWNFAEVAERVIAHTPSDPVLASLWGQFRNADLDLAVADFPAWLLVADPRQNRFVSAESAPGHGAGRAYTALHRVVVSGGDMAARVALHALRPDLLKLYLTSKRLRGE